MANDIDSNVNYLPANKNNNQNKISLKLQDKFNKYQLNKLNKIIPEKTVELKVASNSTISHSQGKSNTYNWKQFCSKLFNTIDTELKPRTNECKIMKVLKATGRGSKAILESTWRLITKPQQVIYDSVLLGKNLIKFGFHYNFKKKTDFTVDTNTSQDYLTNQKQSDGNDNDNNRSNYSYKFTVGVIEGTVLTAALKAGFKTKYLGSLMKGTTAIGAGTMLVKANQQVYEFERDNFIFTKEFEDIMQNPCISEQKKQIIWQESLRRQQQAREEAKSLIPVSQRMIQWVKDNPEELGLSVGSMVGWYRNSKKSATNTKCSSNNKNTNNINQEIILDNNNNSINLYKAKQLENINYQLKLSSDDLYYKYLFKFNIKHQPNIFNEQQIFPSKISITYPSIYSRKNYSDKIVFSKKTENLLGIVDSKYKSQLFERPGKEKWETTLNAARIELTGRQIPLAIERGLSYDHVEKVRNAQSGLLKHIKSLNNRLSCPNLPKIERDALQKELSKASKLLGYTRKFVPRTSKTNQLELTL